MGNRLRTGKHPGSQGRLIVSKGQATPGLPFLFAPNLSAFVPYLMPSNRPIRSVKQ